MDELKAIETYLRAKHTKESTASYLREIRAFLGNNPRAESYLHADIVNYIGTLRKRYSNPRTVSRILSAIKSYYAYLCVSEKREDNPSKSIFLKDKISRDVQLQDLFTSEELEELLIRKDRYFLLTNRNYVLISLLIYQGLRPSEVEQIKLEDVNLEQASIYIRQTNRTNSRTLQLKSSQVYQFHQYINQTRPELLQDKHNEAFILGKTGKAMPSEDLTKHLKRSFKDRFPPRIVNAQTIRQSVITNLLKSGNELRTVQVFAGHKYPSTTERYKQNDLQELTTELLRFHPLQ
jgi:integrase/recombinase XerD